MSDQRRALLLPQELMQFPDTELLLLRGGIPPIHGDKIRYYADGLFRARVEAAPQVAPIPRVVRDDEDLPDCVLPTFDQDRKSVVTGKSLSVRVDLGGSRL